MQTYDELKQDFEIVREASRLFEKAANEWMIRALKAETKLKEISDAVVEYRHSQIWDQRIEEILNAD